MISFFLKETHFKIMSWANQSEFSVKLLGSDMYV